MHVALDKDAFKIYNTFKSYVETVAGQRHLEVEGIGTVELKLRVRPNTTESLTVTLRNVLHVPAWLCNIFSDIHFQPPNDWNHKWTDRGVSFDHKDRNVSRCWGYTEDFCGLDKLVLSQNMQGRSPMLEDSDREVFSVNVIWPQGQQKNWETLQRQQCENEPEQQDFSTKRHAEAKPQALRLMRLSVMQRKCPTTRTSTHAFADIHGSARRGLAQVCANVVRKLEKSHISGVSTVKQRQHRRSSFSERFDLDGIFG